MRGGTAGRERARTCMICDDCTSWYAKMELRPWYFRPSSILVDTTYGINSRELAVLHWSRERTELLAGGQGPVFSSILEWWTTLTLI